MLSQAYDNLGGYEGSTIEQIVIRIPNYNYVWFT
jgi:hypothetical protein